MTRCEWIIFERGSRWAGALRVSVAREITGGRPALPLFEVRSLPQLAERFDARPDSFGMLEVHAGNLAKVLDWLAAASARFPQGRFAALLDTSLAQRDEPAAASGRCSRYDVMVALREAGAAVVSDSPRRLRTVVSLAQRHCAAARSDQIIPELPLQEWAQHLLPWQET